MTITATYLLALIEAELSTIRDERVRAHVHGLLVEPVVVMRDWNYGEPNQVYPCWSVLESVEKNVGIAYCEAGFGSHSPWGLVFLSGPDMSMGMDSEWFESFLAAYFGAIAMPLSIWRAFKQEGDFYPGRALTSEAGWEETWNEVYRLRKIDPDGRYHCSQDIHLREQ